MESNTVLYKPLGELIDLLTDYHANGAYEKLKDNVTLLDKEDHAVMIRTTNFEANDFTNNLIYIDEHAYKFLKKSKVYASDLIMNKIANPGTVYFMPEIGKPVSLGMNLFLIRINLKKANPYFIYAYLRKNEYYVKSFASGSTTKTITKEDVRRLKIYTPPLVEQNEVAQILSTWDQAISATEKLLKNSQQQKKALMQQLLTGKKRFIDKGKSYSFITPKGYFQSKLGELPSDWKVELIKNHLWFQEGPGVRNYQFREEGMKLLNGTNIQFNQLKTENTDTYISEEEAFGIYKHFLIDEGDLLIACSGISIDRFDEKIAFVSSSHLPLCMNTSTMRFKTLDSGNVSITYFKYFMQSPYFKNQIRRQATGSAQLNFGPSHVAQCYVVVPPYEEQLKIVSVLRNADNQIDTLQKKLDCLKREKKALMQQLLTGKKRVKVAA